MNKLARIIHTYIRTKLVLWKFYFKQWRCEHEYLDDLFMEPMGQYETCPACHHWRKKEIKQKCEDCETECLFLDEEEEECLCEVCIGDSEYPRFCEPCQDEWIARRVT